MLHRTKFAITMPFIILFMSCSTNTIISTKALPKGVEIKDFKEDYSAVNGIHEVQFQLVNNTGKTITLPAVGATFYKDGIAKGPAAGGCLEPLLKNSNCSGKVSWLIASGKADSVVFTFDGGIDESK